LHAGVTVWAGLLVCSVVLESVHEPILEHHAQSVVKLAAGRELACKFPRVSLNLELPLFVCKSTCACKLQGPYPQE
jgi:hypothetical protein